MRKLLVGLAFAGCLLSTSEAHAQFANRSLGVSPGFMKLFAPDINWIVPITLDGSIYAENGFDIFIHVPVGIASIVYLRPDYITFAWGGQIGARYLFLEETIRPYVGVQGTVMFIVRDPAPVMFFGGIGLVAGIDFFASDTFSLGPRAFFDGFLGIEAGVVTWRAQLGGVLNFSVYF
jgi:outer membrane protein